MAKRVMINQATRKTAQVVVQNILKTTYFADGVPLDELAEQLKEMYVVMVQEDNTEWDGFLCGSQGECFIRLAPEYTAKLKLINNCDEVLFYEPYENAGLRLTWYKCESRSDAKFEVIGYIS